MQSDMAVNGVANMHEQGTTARAERASTARTPEPRPAVQRGELVRQLAALGLGAAAMYFLDPARGRRRRHLMRDKLVHTAKETGDAIGTTRRDLSNRMAGLAAVVRRRARTDDADKQVVDQLERHDTEDDVPALPGESQQASSSFELLQENWTPAARLVAGVTGGAVAAICLGTEERRRPLRAMMGLAGAALAVRSATNMPFDRLTGIGAGRSAITVKKSITIEAPIHDVFTWLVAWERWPRWMSHVREVTSPGGSGTVGERTHWVVDGPAGTTVEWDAETTRFVPPALIAWRTIEGSPIAHAGTIRLARTDTGATRLDVTIGYNPIAGAAGHAVASLFRRDPKHQLEDDLARLKTTIETGRPPRDAAIRDKLSGTGAFTR